MPALPSSLVLCDEEMREKKQRKETNERRWAGPERTKKKRMGEIEGRTRARKKEGKREEI
jgi:hypothetical protein